jgi:lysosomal alpha-mannosidase
MDTFDGKEKYKKLDKWLQDYSNNYATDNILVLFGDDFWYMDAFMNFENMDRMIAYFNTMHGDRYNMMYSTPSMYVDAMNKLDVNWPVKEDDLFPYQNDPASYWTGYFSSRANAKS